MKRNLVVALLTLGVIVSCSKAEDPCVAGSTPVEKAHLCVQPGELFFNIDDQSGTLIGTSAQEALSLKNVGGETLTISSVTLTGDSEFTKDGPIKTELTSDKLENRLTFLNVFFTPKAYKFYSAELNIVSNSEVNPNLVIKIQGRGCKPRDVDAGIPDGVCPIRDGGM